MGLIDWTVTDADRARFEDTYARYRRMHTNPGECSPMFILQTPQRGPGWPTWAERLADPAVMLRAELDNVRGHMEIGDDAVPAVRVQFGTGQVAAAFGCDTFQPPDSPPCAASTVVREAADAFKLARPSLHAGVYGRLEEFTSFFKENLPPGVRIQHPDIQGPFNNAHLLRGTDLLTDFYDAPEAADALLDVVTDYLCELVPRLRRMIGEQDGWFLDYAALWKGAARISNCSVHMIGPALYAKHVRPRDARLFAAIGGGRIHYCGSPGDVIPELLAVPGLTGLDFHAARHDLWALSRQVPERVVLMTSMSVDSPMLARLLSGDWPEKRNLIVAVPVATVAQGRDLLARLRESVRRKGWAAP